VADRLPTNRPLKVGLMFPDTERETPPFVTGDAEKLAEILRGHAQEGISHVQVVLDPNTVAGVDAFGRVLELLDRP
jgi:hypothetical protein